MKDRFQQEKLEKKKYEDYELNDDGIPIYKNSVYIPNFVDLRRIVMDEIHKMQYLEHPSYLKMIVIARRQYFWPVMKKNIIKYIAKCMRCQQAKVKHQHPIGLLQCLPIPKWKWKLVTITKLPTTSRQHDFIMVMVDKLSKSTHIIFVKSTYKTNDIARIFMREMFRLHGLPKVIVSDRKTKFTCNFFYFILKTWVPS